MPSMLLALIHIILVFDNKLEGFIVRKSTASTGLFRRAGKNIRVKEVLGSVPGATTLEQCAIACVQNISCNSFNFPTQLSASRMCEIANTTVSEGIIENNLYWNNFGPERIKNVYGLLSQRCSPTTCTGDRSICFDDSSSRGTLCVQMRNVALGKPTAASKGSTSNLGVDDSFYGPCMDIPYMMNPWWSVDLQDVFFVGAVIVSAQIPDRSYIVYAITIGYSSNFLANRLSLSSSVQYYYYAEYAWSIPVHGRFVQIVGTTASTLPICEVQVFAVKYDSL